MQTLKSPFPVNGYHGPEYFCDRENEIRQLATYIEGQIPCVLLGIRRMGKTGLIRQLMQQLKISGIYVDLDGTTSLQDLTTRLADGIGRHFPEQKYSGIWKALKGFRPSVSFDPLTGGPQFSFNFQSGDEVKQTLQGLLSLLNERKKPVLLVLDEFQEIRSYSEENTEGTLRSEMQQFTNLRYLFSGSKKSVLGNMLQKGSSPFFSNLGKLHLQQLPREIYCQFIFQKFQQNKKNISEQQVEELVNWTETHTYYTQFVFNQLFLLSGKRVVQKDIDFLKWQILQASREDYLQIKNLISSGSFKLLIAIGKEKEMYKPYSMDHVKNYGLGTPNGTKKALNALLENQLVNEFYDYNEEKYYKLSDVFLMRYIQSLKR